jgi:hypothetical protein
MARYDDSVEARMKTHLLGLLMIVAFSGCAPTVTVVRYYPNSFESRQEVEVLTERPDREYDPIAELSVAPGTRSVLALRTKAQKIGADAIILLGESTEGAIATPFPGVLVATPIRKLRALAIRYK